MVTEGAVVISYARSLSFGDNSFVCAQGQSISCGALPRPYFVGSIVGMKRTVMTAIVIALGSVGPLAAQPFSKSMAECAGLYAFGRD